jgi:UDP:flavonoid glycosyltransferase YjiC (YdhE family)
MKTKKITIEINFPEDQADELISEYVASRGYGKGRELKGTPEEFFKESVIEHIRKSIGSYRRREIMEKVREQQEIARKAADEVDELEIT